MSTLANEASSENTAVVISTVKAVDSPGKPLRRNFLKGVVLDGSGNQVADTEWKKVVGNLVGREANKVLKQHGWQMVRVFMRDEYLSSQKKYRESMKETKMSFRERLIDEAFIKAEREHEPHVERALKTVLPLFKGVSTTKTLAALRNIVRVTANASGMIKSTH